jgi:hypothetical protein
VRDEGDLIAADFGVEAIEQTFVGSDDQRAVAARFALGTKTAQLMSGRFQLQSQFLNGVVNAHARLQFRIYWWSGERSRLFASIRGCSVLIALDDTSACLHFAPVIPTWQNRREGESHQRGRVKTGDVVQFKYVKGKDNRIGDEEGGDAS